MDSGLIITSISEPSSTGSMYPLSSTSNPFGGNSQPFGSSRLTSTPSLLRSLSFIGLKAKSPDIAIAATISGDATKA